MSSDPRNSDKIIDFVIKCMTNEVEINKYKPSDFMILSPFVSRN